MFILEKKLLLFVEFKRTGTAAAQPLWLNACQIAAVSVAANGSSSTVTTVDAKSYTVEGNAIEILRKAIEIA